MLVIALAGLPGSGKSTLARALAPALGGTVLDKDAVRAELFGPGRIEYTAAQDDAVMEALYARVGALAAAPSPTGGPPVVIIDGRTFTRRATVERLREAVARLPARLLLVECVCGEDAALERLTGDAATGVHLAANRGPELYRRLAAAADPIEPPKLVLETDRLPLAEQVERVRAAL